MIKPKISLNKLGEYISANPTRRKRIVEDMKNPKTFKSGRYVEAKKAIKEFFITGYDINVIDKSSLIHKNKVTTTDFQEQDRNCSIELLQKILSLTLPDLSSYVLTKYKGENPKISKGGLEISVNPDLVFRGKIKGENVVGVVKFHTSKSHSLSDDSMDAISALLKEFTETYIAKKGEKVPFKLCIIIDVFGDKIGIAPRAVKRMNTRLLAACQEIVLRWNSI